MPRAPEHQVDAPSFGMCGHRTLQRPKTFKWCKKSIRQRPWRESSQGLFKAITQIQAQAEEAPQPRASLPGRAGLKYFAFPFCPHQQPSLLNYQNPQNIGLNRPLRPFLYFPMKSYKDETFNCGAMGSHTKNSDIQSSITCTGISRKFKEPL